MTKKAFCLAITLFAVTVLNSGPVSALTFSHIVVFGDSLSDNGNLYALSSGTQPASINSYEGRYSNGPVWVEYLARYWGAGLIDLAQGGAETGNSTDLPKGLQSQVSEFTQLAAAYPAMVPDNTLYVIWAGPNDFFGGSQDVAASTQNIGDTLDMLAAIEPGHILVFNMPDLGAIPLNNTSPLLASAAQYLTQSFNTSLASVVSQFKQAHPDINVYEFDSYALFEEIIADPFSYGFTDVTGQYVNDDDTLNDDGNVYLFWDGVHPTTLGHQLIAQKTASQLGADSPAWYTDSGLLTISQVLVLDGYLSYGIALEHIGGTTADPDGVYFKLQNIWDND